MRLPFIKFYSRDWLGDPQLRMVSLAARGLWIEILCLMHCAKRPGYLETAHGKPINAECLARIIGTSKGDVEAMMAELADHGVPSVDEATGAWYSRRMVRDESKREKCGEAGRRGGGNPALQEPTDARDQIPDTRDHISLKVPFKGDVYRSTLEQNSSNNTRKRVSPPPPTLPEWLTTTTGFSPDLWAAWMDTRRRKRASNTPHAIGLLIAKLEQRKHMAVEAIKTAVEAGWQGFEWAWFDDRRAGRQAAQDKFRRVSTI